MNDEKSLLGGVPDFNYLDRYLRPQLMTDHTSKPIQKISQSINGDTTRKYCENIIHFMNQFVPMERNGSTSLKFNRSALEIVKDGFRNGCCDSSTLFTAIARANGIPTMQVITYDKVEAQKYEGTKKPINRGHFMAGVYDKEASCWMLIDPDNTRLAENHHLDYEPLNLVDRNMPKRRYAFAYTEDFRNCEIKGIKIDSVHNIGLIQKILHERLIDKSFYKRVKLREEEER